LPSLGGMRKASNRTSAFRDCCIILLRVSERPLHYSAISRIIREQTSLRPTERQVLGALRTLEGKGIVRRVSLGVYKFSAETSSVSETQSSAPSRSDVPPTVQQP
jgi:hypothetical protein